MPEKPLGVDPASIAIATTTYYPKWYRGKLRSVKHTDKVRGDLALEFMQKAQSIGCQLVVVDGKSSRSFRLELLEHKGINKIVARKIMKRSPARRLAIATAAKLPGVTIIVLTEPEKISLLKDCLSLSIKPIIDNKADIVVPKRDDTLFGNTYPLYMYELEVQANKFFNEILRFHRLFKSNTEDFDIFFGPRIIKNEAKIVRVFMKKYHGVVEDPSFYHMYYGPEDYANTLYFPLVFGFIKKLRIASITVPFSYPTIQKDNEEKGVRKIFLAKRKTQQLSILLDLAHLIGFLEKTK